MPLIRCGFVMSLICFVVIPCPADDSSAAPPIAYTLEINGRPYVVVPDKPLTIEGEFKNPTLTLRVAKTRTFRAAGIAFDYPADFTYEADVSDPEVRTWTMSGNDVTLIVFQFSDEVTSEELADSTAEALAVEQVDSQPIKLKLGDNAHAGVRTTMQFATQTLIQQTVGLPSSGSGSRILVIQEVRTEGEAEAAELPATLQLLSSSFKPQP